MSKTWHAAAGIVLAGATALATMPAQAFWGSWGNGGPWYGGPWHGGPWYGGYPYYGGWGGPWGGYPYYGGWGGYPYHGGWGGYGYGYPLYGAYPYAVAPTVVAPAASSTAK